MDKLKKHIQDHKDLLNMDSPSDSAWAAVQKGLSTSKSIDHLKEYIAQHASELDIEVPGNAAWSHIVKQNSKSRVIRISIKKSWLYAAACILVLIGIALFLNTDRKAGANGYTGSRFAKSSSTPVTGTSIPEEGWKEAGDHSKADKDLEDSQLVPGAVTRQVAIRDTNNKRGEAYPVIKPEYVQAQRKKPQKQPVKLPQQFVQIQAGYGSLVAFQVREIQKRPVFGESVVYFENFVADFRKLEHQEKQFRETVMREGLKENSLDELAMIYQQKLTILKMLQREIDKAGNSKWNITDTIPQYIKL